MPKRPDQPDQPKRPARSTRAKRAAHFQTPMSTEAAALVQQWAELRADYDLLEPRLRQAER